MILDNDELQVYQGNKGNFSNEHARLTPAFTFITMEYN